MHVDHILIGRFTGHSPILPFFLGRERQRGTFRRAPRLLQDSFHFLKYTTANSHVE